MCDPNAAPPTNAAFAFVATGTACVQSADLGPAATALVAKSLVVSLRALDGTLTLRLEAGCQHEGGGCPRCEQCMLRYSPADVGRQHRLAVGARGAVQVLIRYEPAEPGAARAASVVRQGETAVLDVSVESAMSSWLVVIVVGTTLVLLPLCVGLSWWHAKWIVPRPAPRRCWRLHCVHPRWGSPAVQALLAAGLGLVAAGAVWIAATVCVQAPHVSASAVLVAGAALAGLGLLLLLLWAPYALRDRGGPYRCPACAAPVSRWRFRGQYLYELREDGAVCAGKAHARCVRCVACAAPVRQWAGGAAQERPYHPRCWTGLTAMVCASPDAARSWARDPAVTDREVAQMLVATLAAPDPRSADALLLVRPRVGAVPLAGHHSAAHYAAQCGHLRALCALLDGSDLATLCAASHPRGPTDVCSLRLAGPAEYCDVYVPQRPLTYNRRAVYVGHGTGAYLYYYEPAEPDAAAAVAGWCVSTHLGSGKPDFRLLLPELDWLRDPWDAATDVTVASTAGSGPDGGPDSARPSYEPLQPQDRARHGLWRSLKHLLKKIRRPPHTTAAPSQLRPAALSPKSKALYQKQQREDGSQSLMHEPQDSTVFSTNTSLPATMSAAAPVRLLAPPDVGLAHVPHAPSLLECAAASGSAAAVLRTLKAYEDQAPECLVWQWHVGHGLWHTYPAAVQRQVADALRWGVGQVRVEVQAAAAVLDLRALEDRRGPRAHRMRCRYRTLLQHRTPDGWAFAGPAAADVADWGAAYVVLAPAAVALGVSDPETLRLLAQHGVVDASLWAPPAADAARVRLDLGPALQRPWLQELLVQQGLAPAEKVPAEGALDDLAAAAPPWGAGGRRADGREVGRFADGIEAPAAADTSTGFYEAGYECRVGTLAFCRALPDNACGWDFAPPAIARMCADALLKAEEWYRQSVALSPVHGVPIFVYSYELAAGDQLYSVMNRVMREGAAEGIAFWRPLIWRLDQALLRLPEYTGKLFRGLPVRFDAGGYEVGGRLRWPAFSSSSAARSVANEFVAGDHGTLFFLQSRSARAIRAFSHFPDEEEVLFRPNTEFRITATLYNVSEIGKFYSGENVDNIEMAEVPRPPPEPPLDGAAAAAGGVAADAAPAWDTLSVRVPSHLTLPVLNTFISVVNCDVVDVQYREGRLRADVVVQPDGAAAAPSAVPLPAPEYLPEAVVEAAGCCTSPVNGVASAVRAREHSSGGHEDVAWATA